ncbi:four-carbon acid sugar kinase family protein [Stakelama saccharophila]|uniref:Four-carbon acid sugar kinase family protein n=1 Tax=Stakelama saccharophila TaxID=3075605 RepID=A0ABZ0BD89_9SPHN|nr:four-carbon acid sugar kinase family protein [Stakelama sp. W311]WNO55090.1 four-carbon acid sugar kinase family protein [Stakelama sp. W311]
MPDLLYAYYGDDFTGSTDVLESLAEGGVAGVLLLREPTRTLLARFPGVRAVGMAGDSRSRSPEWMDRHLPHAFAALGALGPRIVHYKTCSTFDSSPGTGSIGRAMEIGARMCGGPVPILVGAPHLGRYVVFANLYADAGGTTYRIDRHPTMAHHPVTPMREADLRRHLADQTDMPVGHIPLDAIQAGATEARFASEVEHGAGAILFDGVAARDLLASGRAVLARDDVRFAVGSSGVTRALLAAWEADGMVQGPTELPRAGSVERLLVISGSCSPVTAAQIGWAEAKGWTMLRVDPASCDEAAVAAQAAAALGEGRSTVLYSANGPLSEGERAGGAQLGVRLGRITRSIRAQVAVPRILFAGGDTSSHAVAELGLDALTWRAPLAPGAPLCRAHGGSDEAPLELVLKGGQMGGEDFFESVRSGAGPAAR